MNSCIPGNYDGVSPSRNDAIDFLSKLGVTNVVINGVSYTVINGELKNQETEDPFRIEKLN